MIRETNNHDKALKLYVQEVHSSYKPKGHSDNGGRWYPTEEEISTCCKKVRSPSRSYPFSMYTHCKTKKHIEHRIREHSIEEDKIQEIEAMLNNSKVIPTKINVGDVIVKRIAMYLLSVKI